MNKSNEKAEIIETKVICREPGRHLGQDSIHYLNSHGHPKIKEEVIEEDRYLGWPTLTKTSDGELLVVYSGDRDSHICPWGRNHLIRSKDNGKTWSNYEVINNTPLDDRDAGIIQTQKGTLVVSWFTSLAFEGPAENDKWSSYGSSLRYARHAEKLPQEIKDKWIGNWIMRSEDGGKTWQDRVRILGSAPHGPIELRDGRLMLVGNNDENENYRITVEESKDDGRSWQLLSEMSADVSRESGFCEPHLIELDDGKIIVLFRCHRGEMLMKQSESTDGGKTWTEPHETNLYGYPPHLLKLENDDLLVVYCRRREPFAQLACLSHDNGKTWDMENEIVLNPAASPDMGYPSSVQLADGSIYTVYYQAEDTGKPPCLMATHWKLV
ncbi:MAG: sialidase family protein [Planctomycetota bacterium]|jgi:hypothetical protein